MKTKMKASELRIGNHVTHEDYSSEVFKVLEIEFYRNNNNYIVNTKGGKNGEWVNPIELINPIPLTEEWLLKFGLFKHNNAWVLKNPSSNPFDFDFSIWEDLRYNTAELRPPLKYVHQLQNLYFALTGEELTIKTK